LQDFGSFREKFSSPVVFLADIQHAPHRRRNVATTYGSLFDMVWNAADGPLGRHWNGKRPANLAGGRYL